MKGDMELNKKELDGFTVYFRNEEELDEIYREIFVDEEYRFSSSGRNPRILDCGSHVGLSVLYFKSRHPGARIVAFEPHPINFEILRKNVEANGFDDVRLVRAALTNVEGEVSLFGKPDNTEVWTWGNTIIPDMWGKWDIQGRDDEMTVPAVRLSSYLEEGADFIKIDVEGSEQMIVDDIADHLDRVRGMVVEFHGTPSSRHVNDLDRILSVLHPAGFETAFETSERKNPILIRAQRPAI